jgi:hypothetical protein
MSSAHDFHDAHNRPAPGCKECSAERAEQQTAVAVDNLAEIDSLTCDFANKVGEARQAAWVAYKAVEHLISNQVYDIEMAEGPGGDALHELEVAARALRNAERIATWRRDLMLKVDMTAAAGVEAGR